MGAWLRSSAGVAANGNSANIDATSGGGKIGDVRYVFTACNSNAFGVTSMQGWNQLVNATVAGGMVGLWWKPLVANDLGVSISYNSACDFVVIVCSVAAASTTGTPQSVTASGTGTAVNASSLTPSNANSVELAFFSTQIASAAVTSATFSTPTGMTEHATWNPASGATSGVAGMLASAGLGSTAATGTETSTASTSGTWRTATVVHAPGPVAGAGPAGQLLSFFGGGL